MKTLQQTRRPARQRRVFPARAAPAEANRTLLQDALGYPVQTKLKVGSPDDVQEREADEVADRAMTEPEQDQEVRRKEAGGEASATVAAEAIGAHRGGGQSLPAGERAFFEPRLGADLKDVRLHADGEAARLSAGLSARAFTVGEDVYFGAGEYRPDTETGRRLLAHELAHVAQQGAADTVRRVIELRPPGRGEATAFDRAQELVDRLNGLTTALRYRLDGQVLRYEVLDEARLNEFDRQMRAIMDQVAVIPLRLITGAGYVQENPGAPFEPALHDTWTSGYVDLDDLMASDDLGFKTQLVHYLTERAQTSQYERRIGTFPPTLATLAEFNRVHQRGYEAEERVLRDEIGDPTLRYLRSEERPARTWRVIYRSDEGYRIIKAFRNFGREIVPAQTWAIGRDGQRLSIAELMAQRRARAAPAAPQPAAPAGP